MMFLPHLFAFRYIPTIFPGCEGARVDVEAEAGAAWEAMGLYRVERGARNRESQALKGSRGENDRQVLGCLVVDPGMASPVGGGERRFR